MVALRRDDTAATAAGTGPPSAAWLARDAANIASVLPRVTDVVAASGEGSWLVDIDGRRYLDLAAGIAVTNIGHCHPEVVAAVQSQAATLIHTSVVTRHRPGIELAERLAAHAPFLDDPQVFFCNSGAEAVDGAVKLARRTTGRPGIVAFRRAFHGRTLAATSLTTAKVRYREGYDPLLGAVHHAPYCLDGDWRTALAHLDELLHLQVAASSVAAVFVEPVLGEGGYVVPPPEWLAGLRERCDAIGALLVFDEVQTGVGRTGSFFAAETFGVRPDVVLFAKGIASGLPLGGILAGRALLDRWPTGTHGSTFGGNPVACAAANATIDVIDRDGLYARAVALGERAQNRLRAVAAARPEVVVDVRGVGLMVGIELASGAVAEAVQRACLDAGVIILTCGPDGEVVRLVPALTITDDELELGLATIEAAVRTLA